MLSAFLPSFLPLLLLAAHPSPGPTPETPRKPVVDDYVGGVKVTDDYRWLENASDPKVQAWSEAQNKRAREYLAALPHAGEIRARVKQLVDITPPQYFGVEWHGGKLFAVKFQPPKNQPFLVLLDSPDDVKSERALVDPNAINPKGTTAIDWFEVSRDGSRLAVSLSENGTEEGTVHVYEVATGKEQGDRVPRVNGGTAGGSLTWNGDGTGFYYTRYPRGSERPKADLGFYTQVYFHKLGTKTEADTYEIGKDFPRIAEIALGHSDDGKWIAAQVANGDGGEFALWLKGPEGRWIPLTKYEDKVISLHFGLDDSLYLLSRKDAPHGKILRLPLKTPELSKATPVVPTSDKETIESFLPTKDRLFVADIVGGPSDLRVFDLSGKARGEAAILPVSTVGQLVRLDPASSEILLQ